MHNSAYKNHQILNFKATGLLYIFIEVIEVFWSYKKCQNNGVGRKLVRVTITKVLAQKITVKILSRNGSNPVKMDKKKNVWYLFFRIF